MWSRACAPFLFDVDEYGQSFLLTTSANLCMSMYMEQREEIELIGCACPPRVRGKHKHHPNYKRPWEIMMLCGPCHVRWHHIYNAHGLDGPTFSKTYLKQLRDKHGLRIGRLPMIRYNIYVTEKQLERLNNVARKLDKPVARVVREAIDRYLEEMREHLSK